MPFSGAGTASRLGATVAIFAAKMTLKVLNWGDTCPARELGALLARGSTCFGVAREAAFEAYAASAAAVRIEFKMFLKK